MFRTLTAIVPIVAVFATGTLQAGIFDSSGPDAPLVLFDAEDYDPNTATWPNIGTGGATNDAFAPESDPNFAFFQMPEYRVNDPNLVGGPPTRTANVFAGRHDGVTFDVELIFVPGPEGPQPLFPGQGLIFHDDGLPKGDNREVTFFAVFNRASNAKGGIIGHGKVEEDCCLDENDNLTLWASAEQGPFNGKVQIGSDSGIADSNLDYVAGRITVASATVQSNDAVRFAVSHQDPNNGMQVLQTTGPIAPNANFDNTLADLGHIGFYFDFRPRFMHGDIGMLAIVPGDMSDTTRDTIVNDLYDRYVNGSCEPLIGNAVPQPGDGDCDGDVDGLDFLIHQRDDPSQIPVWEANYPVPLGAVTAAVPEPATASLFAIAALAPAFTRRRR